MTKLRFLLAMAFTALFVVGGAAIAWATPPTPDEIVVGAASDLYDSLSAVVTGTLPYVVLLLAIFIGIRIVIRFFRRTTG